MTRKETEKLAKALKKKSIKCDYFHADRSITEWNDVYEKWMTDKVQLIVATIAFGMGINKKDVRFVIHTALPKSFEGYVQECGWAGWDAQPADCILYYTFTDRKRLDFFNASGQTTA